MVSFARFDELKKFWVDDEKSFYEQFIIFVYGEPPSYSETVWSEFLNVFKWIWSWVSWPWMSIVHLFTSSPEFVGILLALLTVICLVVGLLYVRRLLNLWGWVQRFFCGKRLDSKVYQSTLKLGPNKVSFDGHDGPLLKSITIRNATTVARLQALLDSYSDPTESNKLKIDIILQKLTEETGQSSIPRDDSNWSTAKSQKIWQSVVTSILALEANGTSMSPRDILRKAVIENRGLSILQSLEKSKRVYLSLTPHLSETEAMEIVLPRLGNQFVFSTFCDVEFGSLSFDLVINRARNFEKLMAVCYHDGTPTGSLGHRPPPIVNRGTPPKQQGVPGTAVKRCLKRGGQHQTWACKMKNPPPPPRNCPKCNERHWIDQCPLFIPPRGRQVNVIDEDETTGGMNVENPFQEMTNLDGGRHSEITNQVGESSERLGNQVVGAVNSSVGNKMLIPAQVESIEMALLCDTGATINAISKDAVEHMNKLADMKPSTKQVGTFNGIPVPVVGTINLCVILGGSQRKVSSIFLKCSGRTWSLLAAMRTARLRTIVLRSGN